MLNNMCFVFAIDCAPTHYFFSKIIKKKFVSFAKKYYLCIVILKTIFLP